MSALECFQGEYPGAQHDQEGCDQEGEGEVLTACRPQTRSLWGGPGSTDGHGDCQCCQFLISFLLGTVSHAPLVLLMAYSIIPFTRSINVSQS